MEIKKVKDGENVFLTLEGRLDTLTAPMLQEALSEWMPVASAIEMDFLKVEYVSSAGLRVLLLAEKNMKLSGKSMTLKNVSSEVMEVFDITGFSGILDII